MSSSQCIFLLLSEAKFQSGNPPSPAETTASDYKPQFTVSSLNQTEIKAKRARHLPLPIHRHSASKVGKGTWIYRVQGQIISFCVWHQRTWVWFCLVLFLPKTAGRECPHKRKNVSHQKALQQRQLLETCPVRATLEWIWTGQWLQ